MRWDRASAELNKVLFFSRHEAARLGTTTIEPKHVLLALRHAKDTFAGRLLAHVPFNEIRAEISAPALPPESANLTGDYHYSADTERTYAEAEAHRLQRPYVDTGHLLLALLREPLTGTLLERHGIRFKDTSTALELASHVPLGFTIAESSTPELTMLPYDPALHSEFAGMFRELTNLRDAAAHSAVLTNASTERVTAIVARWTIVSQDGNVRTNYLVRDSYFPVNRGNPLEPGDRLLATPDCFLEAIDISKPHFSISAGTPSNEDASSFTVGLDSAVFESGRIVGPDIHDIAGYIHGRHDAARHIAQLITDAEAAGEDVAAILKAMSTPKFRPDRSWRLALMARSNPQWAKGWLEMPAPPQFFRSG
jgi:hypothetical protein